MSEKYRFLEREFLEASNPKYFSSLCGHLVLRMIGFAGSPFDIGKSHRRDLSAVVSVREPRRHQPIVHLRLGMDSYREHKDVHSALLLAYFACVGREADALALRTTISPSHSSVF